MDRGMGEAQHIVFVSQVGDLVEDYNIDDEWKKAQSAMAVIRNAGIPYSVVPGNHDLNFEAGDATEYDKYFPYTDFTGFSWYGSGLFPQQNGVPLRFSFGQQCQQLRNIFCDGTGFSNT